MKLSLESLASLLRGSVLATAVFVASTASATSVWYADVKTSDLLGNVHGEITALAEFEDLRALAQSVDLNLLGNGLGSGYVGSSPLDITHSFAPDGFVVNHVIHATVYVSVVDDLDLSRERGQIVVDGSVLDSGQATINLFDGDVTALIDSVGDALTVRVRATRGDFRVLFSAAKVHFDGTAIARPTPAVPEPSAALLFVTGAFVVRQGMRRR